MSERGHKITEKNEQPEPLPRGPCECGRTEVLLFKRESWGLSNATDSDLLTYHNTPDGRACEYSGQKVKR